MIWLISGSREFPNEDLVCDVLNCLFEPNDLVIHGGARGVDTWAGYQAKSSGCVVEVYKADWDSYGKAAGFIRNEQMANLLVGKPEAQAVVFWDGESKGTKHMIGVLEANKIHYILIKESKR